MSKELKHVEVEQSDLEEAIAAELERLAELDPLEGQAVLVNGREIFNPVPVAPPIGYKKQPSMVEIVRDMVRSERLKAEVEAAGFETFEEADDFDIGDDAELPRSAYENEFEPPIRELRARGEAEEARGAAELQKKAEEPEESSSPPEPLKKPAKGSKAPPPRAEQAPEGGSEGGPV